MLKKNNKINNLTLRISFILTYCFIFSLIFVGMGFSSDERLSEYAQSPSISEDNYIDDLFIKMLSHDTINDYKAVEDDSLKLVIDSIIFMFWNEYIENPNIDNLRASKQLQKAKTIINLVEKKTETVHSEEIYIELLEIYVTDKTSDELISLLNKIDNFENYISNEMDFARKEIKEAAYDKLLVSLITSLSDDKNFLEAKKLIDRFDDSKKNNHFYRAVQHYCDVEKKIELKVECIMENKLFEINYNKLQIDPQSDQYYADNLVHHHNLFFNYYDLAQSYDYLKNTRLTIEAYNNFYHQIEQILSYDNKTFLTSDNKSFMSQLFGDEDNRRMIANYLNFIVMQQSYFNDIKELGIDIEYIEYDDNVVKKNEIIYSNRKTPTLPTFKVSNVSPKSLFFNKIKKDDFILSINNRDLYDNSTSDLGFFRNKDLISYLFHKANNQIYLLRNEQIMLINVNLQEKRNTIENLNFRELNNVFKATQILINSTASQSLNKFYERKLSHSDPLLIKTRQDILNQERSLQKKVLDLAWVADRDLDKVSTELKNLQQKIADINNQIVIKGDDNFTSNFQRIFDLNEIISLLEDDEILIINFEVSYYSFQWVIRNDGFVKVNKIFQDNRLDKLYLGSAFSAIKSYRENIDEKINLMVGAQPFKFSSQLDHDFNSDSIIASSRGLYLTLIQPIEKYLGDTKKLIFLSHGSFAEIPFSSLFMYGENEPMSDVNIFDFHSGQYLNEKYDIYNIINLHSLEIRSNFKVSNNLNYVGIANPKFQRNQILSKFPDFNLKDIAKSIFRDSLIADRSLIQKALPLPETESEISLIAQNFSPKRIRLLFQKDASETNIKNMDLSSADIINFATHAIPSIGGNEPGLLLSLPQYSTLEDDGVLTPAEISNLNLSTKLVVLSACNTASGNNENSEILSGLAQAFIYAGAENIIVSHWNVESNSTVELMTKFYNYWFENEIKPQEALSLAKQDMINSERYNHPIYWAGFSYYGL